MELMIDLRRWWWWCGPDTLFMLHICFLPECGYIM